MVLVCHGTRCFPNVSCISTAKAEVQLSQTTFSNLCTVAQTSRSWELEQSRGLNGSVEKAAKTAGFLGRGRGSSAIPQTGLEQWGRVRWELLSFARGREGKSERQRMSSFTCHQPQFQTPAGKPTVM